MNDRLSFSEQDDFFLQAVPVGSDGIREKFIGFLYGIEIHGYRILSPIVITLVSAK